MLRTLLTRAVSLTVTGKSLPAAPCVQDTFAEDEPNAEFNAAADQSTSTYPNRDLSQKTPAIRAHPVPVGTTLLAFMGLGGNVIQEETRIAEVNDRASVERPNSRTLRITDKSSSMDKMDDFFVAADAYWFKR
jgi:hypothetical protein